VRGDDLILASDSECNEFDVGEIDVGQLWNQSEFGRIKRGIIEVSEAKARFPPLYILLNI
jgi:hypothetical protein